MIGLLRVLRRFCFWLLGKRCYSRAALVTELPENLRRDTVYVIGESDVYWAAAFVCPCGCGEIVQLSLVANTHPSWTIEGARDGTVTLNPSVWRVRGCKSHFFIRRGQVVWVGATECDTSSREC